MSHNKLSLLLILFLGILLAACGIIGSFPMLSSPEPAVESAPELDNISIPGVPSQAVPLFAENCSACHGPTGGGTEIAPTLNSEELRRRLDDEAIFATISSGRPGTAMPAWGDRLNEDEIRALVALVRSWDRLDETQIAALEKQAQDCSSGMGMHPGMGPMMGRDCGGGMHGPWWWPFRR